MTARAALATILVVYAALFALASSLERAVFGGDIGVKRLQADAFAHGRPWLELGGRGVDPEGRLFPLRVPFVTVEAGRVVTVYRNPVVRLEGLGRGLGLVAAFASVLGLLALAAALARRAHGDEIAWLASLLTLVATPLWLYGLVFWEHAPGALLGLGAVALVAPGSTPPKAWRIAAGALLLGGAISCRPEATLLLFATVAALVTSRRRADAGWLLAGALAVAVLVAISTGGGALLDHLRGNVEEGFGGVSGVAEWTTRRFAIVRGLLAGAVRPGLLPLPFALETLVTAAVLVLAVAAARGAGVVAAAALVVAVLLSVPAAAIAAADGRTLLAGLVTSAPALLLVIPRRAGERLDAPATFLRRVAGTYALLVLVLAPNDGGNQWGPRYLAPLFVLATPALAARLGSAPPWSLAVVTVALSITIQAIGLRNVVGLVAEKERAWAEVAALPGRYLVATAWFVPQEAAELAIRGEKMLLFAPRSEDLDRAIAGLAAAGEGDVTIVVPDSAGAAPGPFALGAYRERERVSISIHPFAMEAVALHAEAR